MPQPSIYLRPSNDLREVAKELKTVADGKALRRELTSGMRAALRPVAELAKSAYRAGPSGRGSARRRGGSLRGALAKAVRIEIRTSGRQAGVRLRTDGRKMPVGMGSIPAYWEGPTVFGHAGRWRHPVFGDPDVWVQQASHPTFYRTVEPHRDAVGRALDEVLDDVKHKIERQR